MKFLLDGYLTLTIYFVMVWLTNYFIKDTETVAKWIVINSVVFYCILMCGAVIGICYMLYGIFIK